MTFRYEFLLDEPEQVRASRLMYHRRLSTRITYGVLALLAIIGVPLYLHVTNGQHVPLVVVPIGLAGIAGAFAALYMSPQTMVRAMRKGNRAAGGPHVYSLDDAGIHVTSPGAQASIEWANMVEALETKEFIIFYYAKTWAVMLPTRVVPAEELEPLRLAIGGWLGPRALPRR